MGNTDEGRSSSLAIRFRISAVHRRQAQTAEAQADALVTAYDDLALAARGSIGTASPADVLSDPSWTVRGEQERDHLETLLAT